MQQQTDSTTNIPAEPAEYIPITIWPHPWPTQGAWRALIFAADTRKTSKGTIHGNGLIEAGVIRRVGRRVLVNPSRFFAWVESQGGRKMSAPEMPKAAAGRQAAFAKIPDDSTDDTAPRPTRQSGLIRFGGVQDD